jgi:hypothetical protein
MKNLKVKQNLALQTVGNLFHFDFQSCWILRFTKRRNKKRNEGSPF